MSSLKDKYVRKFVNQSLNLAHNLGIKKGAVRDRPLVVRVGLPFSLGSLCLRE